MKQQRAKQCKKARQLRKQFDGDALLACVGEHELRTTRLLLHELRGGFVAETLLGQAASKGDWLDGGCIGAFTELSRAFFFCGDQLRFCVYICGSCNSNRKTMAQ